MKKALCVLFTVLILTGLFPGCTAKPKPLRICMDLEYIAYNDVGDVDLILDEFLYTLKESGGLDNVEIEYIPASGTERESMVDRIRTEVMTGGGPDVFIINCASLMAGDVSTTLFPMPEKMIENGIFLPLDKYMEENTCFTEWDKLTQSVLEAGRSEEGQQIIPLTYTLPLLCYRKSEGTVEPAPGMTWTEMPEGLSEQAMLLGDGLIPFAGQKIHRPYLEYVIGDLADYSEDELLFTEEMLLQYIRQIYAIRAAADGREDPGKITDYFEDYLDVGFIDGTTPMLYNISEHEPRTMVPYYTASGGVAASVTSYAAINRNTERAEDAFTVIDLLLRDVVQRRYKIYTQLLRMDAYGIPMHEALMQEDTPTGQSGEWYLSDENFAELSKVRDQISTAFFQDTLCQQFWYLQEECEQAVNNGQEERIEEIVSDHYGKMKRLMAE